MMRIKDRLVEGIAVLGAVAGLAGGIAGCSEAKAREPVAVRQEALDLAKECGLECAAKGEGLIAGNAAISGVASIDAFFGSVVNFEAAANGVTGGINAQLEGIRADFGIAADADLDVALKAQFDANLEAGYSLKVSPAKCQADVQATLEASAKCDASVSPGKASVQCSGTCEAEAGATLKCEGDAKLQCSFTNPSVMCEGKCEGDCTVDISATGGCTGSCEGTCEGTCMVKNTDGSCAGKCDGKCSGTCKAALEADGSCMAKCEGQCTAKAPTGGCDASAKASCEGSATAKVECTGKCDGDFEPPMAKAECQASAKADAKINVQCTPPRVEASYTLKAAASADVAAQLKFKAALKAFVNVRLPALMASLKKSSLVLEAGADLTASAGGAIKGSIDVSLKGKLSLKQTVGLGCALTELGAVGGIVGGATAKLDASFKAATKLTKAVVL
jgi:hypothetical protein